MMLVKLETEGGNVETTGSRAGWKRRAAAATCASMTLAEE